MDMMRHKLCECLWILGAGKMGQALYQGWRRAGLDIGSITLIDPAEQPVEFSLQDQDCWLQAPPTGPSPDVILLAVKPQMMRNVLPYYREMLRPKTLILSIAAGISLDVLSDLCGNKAQPVIRAMPNTPALIGQGMTAAIANDCVTAMQRALAQTLFEAVGQYVWLSDEDQMHAVTALSGSGPAYLFALIEALMEGGVAQGLPPDLATLLARQTVIGAAALAAAQPDVPAATLRDNVTSPNGTTAAGLAVLQRPDAGLTRLLTETLKAASERSRALGA